MTVNKFYSCLNTGDILGAVLAIDGISDLNNSYSKLSYSTPLDFGVQHNAFPVVELLLERGANIDQVSYSENTPLMSAVVHLHTDMIDFLLEKGANTDVPVPDGATPLKYAIDWNDVGIARKLLDAHADVDREDARRWSMLHRATRQGNLEMIKLLIEYGAKIHSMTIDGDTCLDIARSEGYVDILEYLSQL